MAYDLEPELRDYEGEIRRLRRSQSLIRRFLLLIGSIMGSIAGAIVILLFLFVI
jgi:hypothetical protein